MIDIITVHQNIHFLVSKLILTLREKTDVPYRLIVVDNNSTNGSLEVLRKNKEIVLIELTPKNYFEKARTLPLLQLPGGAQNIMEHNVLTHGQCLDVAIGNVQSDFFVTIDTDVLVNENWLGAMLKEMENKSVACVGQSKFGPYDLSRIWVANCLYRTEYFMENRHTMQPVRYGTKIYDTGDYQSIMLWLKYQNRHLPNYSELWNHICGFNWFYNCLRKEPEYRYYRMFDDKGKFCVDLNNRPLYTITNASWWYQKLYTESLPNEIDVPWTLDDHLVLMKKLKDMGLPVKEDRM